jgi:dienelactone hydrolase
MKMFTACFFSVVLIVLAGGLSSGFAKIQGTTVEYSAEGVGMKGYLAYDDAVKGVRPGVLVVHEWWGLNDYAKRRARMLAALGYTALAVDMYGGGKQAMHPDDAKKFSSELMSKFDVAKARFETAMDFIKKQATVDPGRIAAIGYCFGGGVVLNMARQGADLKGVVSFHGSLTAVKPAAPGEVKAKILVLNGADDKFVPIEQIEALKNEMANANVDYKFINYPGAVHSYTNPDSTAYGKKFKLPLAYNAAADKKSWQDMTDFFIMIFK